MDKASRVFAARLTHFLLMITFLTVAISLSPYVPHSVGAVPTPNFRINVTPTGANIVVGSTTNATIMVKSVNSFAGIVNLSYAINPQGPSVSINPITVLVLAGGTSNATLTVSTTPHTPAGIYTITVSGSSLALTRTATFTGTVQDFTVTANPLAASVLAGVTSSSSIIVTGLDGFTGTVTLSFSASPSTGFLCTLGAKSITLSPTITSGSSKLSCNGSIGNYEVTATGTSISLSHSAKINYQVTDFTLSTSATGVTVDSNQGGTSTVTVNPVNGFTSMVSLTTTISPTNGLTCALSLTNIAVSATSILSCKGSTGTYDVSVIGTSDGASRTVEITYTVVDFNISATSPAAMTVGVAATSTITVTSLNGFTRTVSLTDTAPAGLTCNAISPLEVAGSGTASVSCSANVAGTYTLKITGTNGSLSHSASVVFAFTDFRISVVSPAPVTVGSSASATINVDYLSGFAGTVSLTSIVPTGLTCGGIAPSSVTATGTASISCTSAIVGTYTVTITGRSGSLSHSDTTTFTITDFRVSATSPATVTVGISATSMITLTGLNGFAGPVSFTDTAPADLHCGAITPVIVTNLGSASISCSSTVAGTYALTITGRVGTLTHTAEATFTVTDFRISSSPSAISVIAETTAHSTISLTGLNGFTGTVSLSVLGAPSGCTTSLTPTGLSIDQNSETGASDLAIKCTGPVTGILNVTATSGSISYFTPISLAVKDFLIGASSNSERIIAGAIANSTITISSANGFEGNVNLALAVSPPSGLDCALSPVSLMLGTTETSTLSCRGASGVYTVTVTGTSTLTSSHSIDIAVSVTSPANGMPPSPPEKASSTSGNLVLSTLLSPFGAIVVGNLVAAAAVIFAVVSSQKRKAGTQSTSSTND